ENLRKLDRDAYVYAVSVFPSLGINSYFIGGNETEFSAPDANRTFGPGTVVTGVTDIKSPVSLMMFASARSAISGSEANGYYQVAPPFLTARRWASKWTPQMPPEEWGFVAPRFEGRVVTAKTDGHVESLNTKAIQDMRRWCNTADKPDFTLSRY